MSNESENKRIDLTQFDGMYDTEGIGPHPKNYFEEVETKFIGKGVKTKPLYLSNQEVNAITLLPELITELKRCYKELDVYEEIKEGLLEIPYLPHSKIINKALDLATIVHESEEEE